MKQYISSLGTCTWYTQFGTVICRQVQWFLIHVGNGNRSSECIKKITDILTYYFIYIYIYIYMSIHIRWCSQGRTKGRLSYINVIAGARYPTLLVFHSMLIFTATHCNAVIGNAFQSAVDKLSVNSTAIYVTSSVHIQCV